MKRIIAGLCLALSSAVAYADPPQVVSQYVCGVNGAGTGNLYCSPGNANGAVGFPVQVTGGTGGTVTANQGTPNAGGANAWPVSQTGAIPAGTNIIGKVGIDQTTPGTTNAVSATNFPMSVSTGTGAQGASSPRVTVATDTATVAGSATLPAGTNVVGKVGIDQTTPGTTNAVSATNFPANVSTGTGGVGANTPRLVVGQDTTTIAGSAPGTAGTPSTNVLSVQGVAGGTTLIVGGNVASGSSDSGNPVKTGGVYTTGALAASTGQRVNTWADQFGNNGASPQCGGCTFETASATGTTAATTATLAAAASKTTYICGFSVRANATAAATGNATVTGTITGTLNFTQWTAPLATGIGITEPSLGERCIPASGTNQAIAVVSAAPGSGGVVSVTAWGFQQ